MMNLILKIFNFMMYKVTSCRNDILLFAKANVLKM